MKIKSIQHVFDGLEKLVDAIYMDKEMKSLEKINLIDSIKAASFINYLYVEKIEPLLSKQLVESKLASLLELYEKKVNDIINNFEEKNGILRNYNDLFFGLFSLEIKTEKINKLITSLGEDYAFLKLGLTNQLSNIRKEEFFIKNFKEVTDEILDNFEYFNLNSRKYYISYNNSVMIVNNNDFKDFNMLATNFSNVSLLILKNNENLKEEFVIAKNFYQKYSMLLENELQKAKNKKSEDYSWLNEYWTEKYMKNINKSAFSLFGFEKLEKKIIQKTCKMNQSDTDFVLKELYKLLQKEESKTKDFLSYNISEKYIKNENELVIVSQVLVSDKRGLTDFIRGAMMKLEEYDLNLRKIDSDIFVLKIIDKTENKYIIRNEYEVTSIVANLLNRLVNNIINKRKSVSSYSQRDFTDFINSETNQFFENISKNIRAKRLLSEVKEEVVKIKKKI